MYVITIAWAAEGVILAIIGLRYRSVLTQIGAAAALALSCGNLLLRLPMHAEAFRFVLNPPFGTWCFVAAVTFVGHLIYRQARESPEHPYGVAAQMLYALSVVLLFAAATMEWYHHCHYNLTNSANYTSRGQVVIFAATLLLLVIRPIRPAGQICDALAAITVAAGTPFIAAVLLPDLHKDSFTIFVNLDFGVILVFIAALLVYHIICRRRSESPDDPPGHIAQVLFGLIGFLLFAAATAEWYCHCRYNLLKAGQLNYIARGQMIIFAAMLLLFSIRPVCPRGKSTGVLSWIFLAGGSAFAVSALLGLHTGSFAILVNPEFAALTIFILALLVCHAKYRLISGPDKEASELSSQIIYGVAGLLLLLAAGAEWYWHCKHNLQAAGLNDVLVRGQVIIFSVIMLLLIVRPVSPRGPVAKVLASVLAAAGAVFIIIAFPAIHTKGYAIFANMNFVVALLFVTALFASAWLLHRISHQEQYNRELALAFALGGILVLWVLLNEEIYLYWYCRNRFGRRLENWAFLAQMYISVMWAVYAAALMVIGFWRRIGLLRYIAIGLFTLLLIKVFAWDTRRIEQLYRIGAFLATGLTLLGTAYLYQFLRKKGFFETMLAAREGDK
jgi:hypothetical protein